MISDTIAACATAGSPGAISLIRISGPEALAVAGKIFFRKNGETVRKFGNFKIHYGHLRSGTTVIDEVLLHVMKSPRTFTGEDTVEITCHGGAICRKMILDLLTENGIRLAEPGEFSRRAFANGKIDLVKAEAIDELIRAGNEYAYRTALAQLRGALSSRLQDLKELLMEMTARAEALLDFPEEGIEEVPADWFMERIRKAGDDVSQILAGAVFRKVCTEGVFVVIAGPPNAGKSTLFNFLCGSDRAIVDSTPGTTRDYIECDTLFNGLPVRLVDTAGLREAGESAEAKGIGRARILLDGADLILLVLSSENPDWDGFSSYEGKQVLKIVNKIDLTEEASREGTSGYRISLKTGEGLADFQSCLENCLRGFFDRREESAIMVNARQQYELEHARSALSSAGEMLSQGRTMDLVCSELKQALFNLRSILGEITAEDVLDGIFSRFCIGK
ncbi:MAG: tRNA uridine-5-carboxymethylaminomethyl(34) synthesis GTPase MnmE [Candidatus Wallbacteria bacterium]|nr:tRNA uridine-5-carboxymethylaminomethyl(34) synthesis GTPase MnmE [Candidatus Wallbacteria bacterium]